jgi:hypothetical protein
MEAKSGVALAPPGLKPAPNSNVGRECLRPYLAVRFRTHQRAVLRLREVIAGGRISGEGALGLNGHANRCLGVKKTNQQWRPETRYTQDEQVAGRG